MLDHCSVEKPGNDATPAAEPVADSPSPMRERGRLNRRSFLKWTAAVGAAAGLSEAATQLRPTWAGVSLTQRQQASRLLAQCSFGGDTALIDAVESAGIEGWLDSQMALPLNLTLDEVQGLLAANPEAEDIFVYFDWIWWQRAMTAPDVLRQRVAYSLSQIFVIGRTEDLLFDTPTIIAAFYDVLQRHAFGNFKDLLLDVALQPSMGIYLSHLWNAKSNPSLNRFPDENFAREVMQLFSIGLFKLNPDGSRQLDGSGEPIPTYSNAQITEMAKIFTGLTFASLDGAPISFGGDLGDIGDENFWDPMVMWEPEHEPGPKTLLDGFVVPAGQTGMQDIEAAITHLFEHPNVGPFFGRLLIQRLVTSNPSPAYISRVSAAFADNGSGVRGDMKAVLEAILLDPEARDLSHLEDPHFGKVREPFVRWVQLGRAFHATSDSGQFRHFGGLPVDATDDSGEANVFEQYPFFSRSVFNFYSPDHQPAGPLAAADLVAPELQIIHSYTTVTAINLFHRAVWEDHYIDDTWEEIAWLDLSTEVSVAETGPNELIDHLDLLLTYGTLSSSTRQTILDSILPLAGDADEQVRMALFLIVICPEFGIQR